MWKYILVLLTCCVSILHSQEKFTLSLEEAIQTGLKESTVVAISGMSVRAAEARVREMTTAFYPSVIFNGSFTRLSDVPAFTIDLPVENFPANGIEIFPNIIDHYSARISMRQPLFTGFRLSGDRRAARYAAEAEQHGHKADKSELAYAIAVAYWNIYRLKESERMMEASVDQLSTHLKNVEYFYDEGIVTRNEVLKVRVQLSNTRVRLFEVRNNVQIAMIQLNNLIGLPLTATIELSSDPGLDIAPDPELDDYISTAVNNNPGILELDSRKQMNESVLDVARSGWYPQIYLFGNYYYQRPHQRYLPLRDEFNESWDIGITLSFDILNWGAVSHRTSQAEAQLRRTEYVLDKRRDDIAVEVTQSYLEVLSAREQADAARIAVEHAGENFRVTEDLFREEMVVNADVLDADVALLQARMAYIDALTRYEVAKAGLRKAVGTEMIK